MGVIYALMEIKHMCEEQEVCANCPLFNEFVEECGVTNEVPYLWKLKYDIPRRDKKEGLFLAVEEDE